MTVVLSPPADGDWLVMHPPGHPQHAHDLIGVDGSSDGPTRHGRGRSLIGPLRAEDFHGWDRAVRAPADAQVVSAVADVTDRLRVVPALDLVRLVIRSLVHRTRLAAMAGNHVLLEADAGFVLLAHLRRGSVSVNAGDRVEAGQVLGRVGNSGASLGPHLHIQLTDAADLLRQTPVPFSMPFRERVGHGYGDRKVAPLPRHRARVRFGP